MANAASRDQGVKLGGNTTALWFFCESKTRHTNVFRRLIPNISAKLGAYIIQQQTPTVTLIRLVWISFLYHFPVL